MTEIPVPDPDEAPARDNGLLRRAQPLLTLLIAFTAIALTLWEGIENRRHNRLSVQPRLDGEIATGRDGDTAYARISVEGTGLGPAAIKAFRIYFDGRLQDAAAVANANPWRNVIEATSGLQVTTHALAGDYYFPAGRQQVLFEARQPRAAGARQSVSDLLDRIGVQICYCSVYDTDCGQLLLTTRQVKAPDCPH